MDEIDKKRVVEYYAERLKLAEKCANKAGYDSSMEGFEVIVSAVFEKLAKDLFYLENNWKMQERIQSSVKQAEDKWVATKGATEKK